MIYIKENSDGKVTLAGEVANQTMLDEGYIQYNGVVPDYDPTYQYLTLDATGTLIVNVDSYLSDLKAYEQRKKDMLTGQVYTLNTVDYQISLTSEDAAGVMQVHLADLNGSITNTVMKFKNGTTMPLQSVEIPAFVTWFINARQSFFQPGMVITEPKPPVVNPV